MASIDERRQVAERIVARLDWVNLKSFAPRELADAIDAALSDEHRISFDQGFILAVAEIMRQHDEDVIAADVLRANRPTDWSHIDKYDMDALKPIFEHEAAVAAIRKLR